MSAYEHLAPFWSIFQHRTAGNHQRHLDILNPEFFFQDPICLFLEVSRLFYFASIPSFLSNLTIFKKQNPRRTTKKITMTMLIGVSSAATMIQPERYVFLLFLYVWCSRRRRFNLILSFWSSLPPISFWTF